MTSTKRASLSLEQKYEVFQHCQERPNIRFYEVQTYANQQFEHSICKSRAHRLMAMKEIDFDGFIPNVKKKRRVKHPEFEKELLKFVSRARVTGYLKIWS